MKDRKNYWQLVANPVSGEPVPLVKELLNPYKPEPSVPPYIKPYFLRFKGFPPYINKQDIVDLLFSFSIPNNDIVLSYDIFGRKTGDAVIRTYHERNHREILTSFSFYYFNNEAILDLVETNESDFISCSKSESFLKENVYTEEGYKKIFLKMSEIPSSVKEEDIRNFFKNYAVCENGIKISRHRKGSSNGEAVIAFIDENECRDVLTRENGRLLMNKIISLKESDLDKFEEFASSSAFSNWIKVLSEYILADEVQRSLFVSGLPLDVTKEAFQEHLQIFNINQSNLVVDEKLLTENGSIIIKFFNEEDSNEAKEYLLKEPFIWKFRKKKLSVENLLVVVNQGNEN